MKKFFIACLSLGFIGAIVGLGLIVWVLFYYGDDLPDYSKLKDYEPPIVSRVYAADGNLMAEFATEKRVFVPIHTIPDLVVDAFLSAEDQNFWIHPGIDATGVARAIYVNLRNRGTGRRLVGASTITQQVAKNFLLTNEVSVERKIKEAILAFRLEKAFSKEKILELYLNEIYLGRGAYGVAAASLEYFNKTLDELTIEEAAYLAALPKGPNNYQPDTDYDDAVDRRNWVISRLLEEDYITDKNAEQAREKPLKTDQRNNNRFISAPYFAEEVRREIKKLYGEDSLYEGGLIVHASVDAEMQQIAEKALRDGLVEYDRRHGWHSGPLAEFETTEDWENKLRAVKAPLGIGDWSKAVVLKVTNEQAEIGLPEGQKGIITYNKMKWAAKRISDFRTGPTPNAVGDVLSVGDVVLVAPSGETVDDTDVYHLRQFPDIQGGIVVLDPHTGRVLAMVGGFSQEQSEFNRVTQAKRQPGSAFKPIVYLTALENGFTPATLILDAPFTYDQGPGLPKWRPQNYSREFYGPTPLRVGIEKSRNLMTVRLANYIGMEKVAEMTKRLGVNPFLAPMLSMSIGAGETTLLKMSTAYGTIGNGGKKIVPTFIDRIQNRHGETIFKHDKRHLPEFGPLISWKGQDTPTVPDTREQILDPRHAYQMTSIMEGVVKRGTGASLRSLGFPLAGKTGTTNESKDTWFIGFTPNLVVGVYAGFDQPRPLGDKETGSRVAAPIVKQFFEEILKDQSPTPFRAPDGIRRVRINAEDGTRAEPGDENVIWEAFIAGTEPGDRPVIFDGETIQIMSGSGFNEQDNRESLDIGTGGIY
ncbi:MAG: penicillin-binding protein 1A [Pseudomonadota bacterium]